MCRDSDDDDLGGNVVDDDRSRTDDRTRAEVNALTNDRAGPDVGFRPNVYGARQTGTRRNVYVACDAAVVFDDRPRVDEHVVVEPGIGMDDASREQLSPRTDLCILGNAGPRVDDRQRLQAVPESEFKEFDAQAGISICRRTRSDNEVSDSRIDKLGK